MSKLFSSKASNGAINFSLLLLRIGFGALLFWNHGYPKFKAFSALKGSFADPLHIGSAFSLGLAVFAEIICAGLVVLGVATRLSSGFIAAYVALFMIYGHHTLEGQEPGIIWLTPFLALLFAGPGKFSVDNAIGK
jgi:putative oxidoreductase